jgi:radical SAM superfamily enzyme YgiQ (UPF0313 family)
LKPRALLLFPPVYDFALFDMYLKPFSLLRIGKWLSDAGWEISLVNALDYAEEKSLALFGRPKRYPDGTGKFFRSIVEKPKALASVPRYFARYGILRAVLEEKIRAARPDIVLVSSGMTYWYLGVREAVECVRAVYPRVPVVLGGVYATLCADHARAHCAVDYLVPGPAEAGLPAILHGLGLPLPKGPLPFSQLKIPEAFHDAAAIRLHSGCPLSCAYCASSLVSGDFSAGSGEALFAETAELHGSFGIGDFSFYDDALLVDSVKGIIPFLSMVIESKLSLRFYVPNGLHVALITEEIARLMKQAGVRDFKLGFESAEEEFHAAHDNKYTRAMFEQALSNLEGGGFTAAEIAVYVLAGLPHQYPEQVEESIRFAARFGVQVFVAEYSPIPGTALWETSVACSPFPIAEEPLCHNNSIFPMQWERFTSGDLQSLKQLARTLTRRPRS